jgi:protein-tyrosine phosphatase
MNILFVCTANITRSAMSAAILKKMISDKGLQDLFLVDSAGTEALHEMPSDEKTTEVCKDHDIDISAHRAQQVTHAMVHDASLILCMAEPHRRIIRGIFPQWERKILLLKEFGQDELPKDTSVSDPTGGWKRKYEKCFEELETEIARIFPLLEEMAQWKKNKKA